MDIVPIDVKVMPDGYEVSFVLNKDIACEMCISANDYDACNGNIIGYIRNKIGGIK
ncbi:hypothetical protein [Clostridium kluyveri]|uniref:hypothetical protein n=1 Tax=Clostridium kluyveri TaxID=1534 RepID=UPI0022472B6E|nr:hypothetical protein [Clostridium kluyveri]UZQ51599.1 hypothetical protein OP486_05305 [Clostridium kluyveri]